MYKISQTNIYNNIIYNTIHYLHIYNTMHYAHIYTIQYMMCIYTIQYIMYIYYIYIQDNTLFTYIQYNALCTYIHYLRTYNTLCTYILWYYWSIARYRHELRDSVASHSLEDASDARRVNRKRGPRDDWRHDLGITSLFDNLEMQFYLKKSRIAHVKRTERTLM